MMIISMHFTVSPMRSIAALLGLFVLPAYAFAAFTGAPNEPFLPQPGTEHVEAVDPSLTSCFNYYRFGSTPVVIQSQLSTVAQGAQIGFTGTIENQNDYPISQAAMYAKVLFYPNPAQKDSFGPEVVDFYKVADGLTLPAHSSKPLAFSWTAPLDADLGAYELATYVVSHDRFNMSGLTFTTDIVGGTANFQIVGSETGTTHIDIHATLVGPQVLHGAAFAPKVEVPQSGLPVTVHLTNTSSVNASGTLTWKLYSWDTLQKANLIDSKQVPANVPAGNDVAFSYTAADSAHTVYELLVEYAPNQEGMAHSFQSIRFINTALNTPRINFVGAAGYPGSEGDTAFACFHSTGTANAENVRVELTASSNSLIDLVLGRSTRATKTYEGRAPGNIYAVTAPLSRGSDAFTVSAKVYQDGKLIDQVSVPYTCAESSRGCPIPYAAITGGILVLILIGGSLFLYLRRKKTAITAPTL